VGSSRKGFISRVLALGEQQAQLRHNAAPAVAHATSASVSAEQREWGTAATVAVSIMGGANIVRVHDVAAMRAVRDVTDQIHQSRY